MPLGSVGEEESTQKISNSLTVTNKNNGPQQNGNSTVLANAGHSTSTQAPIAGITTLQPQNQHIDTSTSASSSNALRHSPNRHTHNGNSSPRQGSPRQGSPRLTAPSPLANGNSPPRDHHTVLRQSAPSPSGLRGSSERKKGGDTPRNSLHSSAEVAVEPIAAVDEVVTPHRRHHHRTHRVSTTTRDMSPVPRVSGAFFEGLIRRRVRVRRQRSNDQAPGGNASTQTREQRPVTDAVAVKSMFTAQRRVGRDDKCRSEIALVTQNIKSLEDSIKQFQAEMKRLEKQIRRLSSQTSHDSESLLQTENSDHYNTSSSSTLSAREKKASRKEKIVKKTTDMQRQESERSEKYINLNTIKSQIETLQRRLRDLLERKQSLEDELQASTASKPERRHSN